MAVGILIIKFLDVHFFAHKAHSLVFTAQTYRQVYVYPIRSHRLGAKRVLETTVRAELPEHKGQR